MFMNPILCYMTGSTYDVWVQRYVKEYYVTTISLNHDEAAMFCAEMNASLVTITHKREQDFINALIRYILMYML